MENTQKPIDRLSPHCHDGWSNMEEWGGNSWFSKTPYLDEEDNDNSNTNSGKRIDTSD